MRHLKIKTFYNPKQVLEKDSYSNYSKSPLKPKLLLNYLKSKGLLPHFEVVKNFNAFSNDDFKIAHTKNYVKDFFKGGPTSSSNGLSWNHQFAESVRYTNASLHAAIKNSILNPAEISFSPTSGFHHARPSGGSGFCTFSGQVIASVKIWRELGKVGCYLDLDGHFGNSIEDTRSFQPELDLAVPPGFNFNPKFSNEEYYQDLVNFIKTQLEPAILSGKIDYVVWCHGADSHEDDQLGHQCSTEWWVKCANFFWSWVSEMDLILGKPLPVSCALFGGYRDDDYTSVLSLHTMDLIECIRQTIGLDVKYTIEVQPRQKYGELNGIGSGRRIRRDAQEV